MSILRYFQFDKNTTTSSPSSYNTTFEMNTYDIFTDGSEIKHKTTYKTLAVAWAYVIKFNRETMKKDALGMHNLKLGNNQRAELMAIYKSLESLHDIIDDNNQSNKNDMEINIYTDSDYALKSLTVWSLNWKRNGWKTANKKPVKHKDIIEPCLDIVNALKKNGHIVSFHHVRSHTNKTDYISLGNNEADILAQSTAKTML